MFIGLDNLEILRLEGNRNICFDDGVFKGLKKLKHLDLSKCDLQQLEENMFVGLESLNLKGDIGTFFRFPGFSNNEYSLVFQKSCFNSLRQLKNLNLSYCNIFELKENVFIGLDNLEILNLNYNPNIIFEDGCFNGLKQLNHLDLSQCNLKQLKENMFIGLDNLEILDSIFFRDILFRD